MPGSMDTSLTGRCDFCQFSNTKLFPLTCMRHFYCTTCQQFVKRLQNKDFSCKLCERKQRQIQAERRRESRILDSFIDETATERRGRHFREVPLTMSGAQVIRLDNDKDDFEQGDLTGNNEEWDLLISNLSYQPSCAEKKPGASDRGKSPMRKHAGDRYLKKGVTRSNLPGLEDGRRDKPIPLPPGDKLSEESRIYDWCVAAKNSLTSTANASVKCDQFPANQLVCVSSSSENTMGQKKYLQQSRKKERSFWWDDQSDSDEGDNWDECFSKAAPFFTRTSAKADKEECFAPPGGQRRNCTPDSGEFNFQAAISKTTENSLNNRQFNVQSALLNDNTDGFKGHAVINKEDSLDIGEFNHMSPAVREFKGHAAIKRVNNDNSLDIGQFDLHSANNKGKSEEFKGQTAIFKDNGIIPEKVVFQPAIFKDSINPKDPMYPYEWSPVSPVDEPPRTKGTVVESSSQRQLPVTGHHTWANKERSPSPLDLTDSFWDQ